MAATQFSFEALNDGNPDCFGCSVSACANDNQLGRYGFQKSADVDIVVSTTGGESCGIHWIRTSHQKAGDDKYFCYAEAIVEANLLGITRLDETAFIQNSTDLCRI